MSNYSTSSERQEYSSISFSMHTDSYLLHKSTSKVRGGPASLRTNDSPSWKEEGCRNQQTRENCDPQLEYLILLLVSKPVKEEKDETFVLCNLQAFSTQFQVRALQISILQALVQSSSVHTRAQEVSVYFQSLS